MLLRLALAMFMWLIVMPIMTCWLYRIWLPRFSVLADRDHAITKDIVSGLSIASVIALSFIVMMSFTDFLRNHWDLGNQRPRRPLRGRAQVPLVVPAAALPAAAAADVAAEAAAAEELPAVVEEWEEDHQLREERRLQRRDAREVQAAQQVLPVAGAMDAADEEAILNALEEEGDMHMALEELLGLRGPWYIPFRNVMWLLLFNAIYIGLFAFVPYNIGLSARAALLYYFEARASSLLRDYVPAEFISLFNEYMQLSNESRNDLQLPAIFTIAFGFSLTAAVAFGVSSIISHMHSTIPRVFINNYVATFNEFAMITKVGLLLFHRIFVLPIVLGLAILACLNGFIEYPQGTWIEFVASNLVGFLALAWAMGISFMLTVTLTVLQLREVLHPEVLARVIRPQEAHADLLQSLKHESTLTHARRTCISMMVYLMILIVFVYLPICICKSLGSSLFPVRLQLWYCIPEIQLPVELSIAHILFLTVLERKKDLIGQLEHRWFKWTTRLLGMQRCVLPFAANAEQAGELTLMVRPAPNWDAHNGDAVVSRWAWGEEPINDIEQTVEPREVPADWLPKSIFLVVVSWLVLVCLVLAMIFVPVLVGQFLFYAFRVPSWLYHDPLCYIIGLAFSTALYRGIEVFAAAGFYTALLAAVKCAPISTVLLAVKFIVLHLASCCSVGCLVSFAKLVFESTPWTLSAEDIQRDTLLGIALVHVVLFLGIFGPANFVLRRYKIEYPLETYASTLREILSAIGTACLEQQWPKLRTELEHLGEHLVTPMFFHFALRGLALIPILAYFAAMSTHAIFILVSGFCIYSMEYMEVSFLLLHSIVCSDFCLV